MMVTNNTYNRYLFLFLLFNVIFNILQLDLTSTRWEAIKHDGIGALWERI